MKNKKSYSGFKYLTILAFINLLSSIVSAAPAPANPPFAPPSGFKWEMVDALTDNFNGNTIDASKWHDTHPVWSGRYPSQFKKGNAFVQDGLLYLRSTSRINSMSEISSPTERVWIDAAAVVSKEKIAEPGWYYETSMKASDTAMSSSFWFRMGGFSEIDVIEHIGHATKAGVDGRKSFLYEANTHVYGSKSGPSIPKHYKMSTRGRDEFHRYGLWWKDAENLWFYHNGKKVFEIKPAVKFDEKLHMIFDTETLASQFVGYPTIESLKDNSRNAMLVDWVKTWRLVPGTPEIPGAPSINLPGRIEAEAFSNQNGIQTENTSDTGGGQNIGYINNGDSAIYNVNVTTAGSYQFNYRVASATSGGNIVMRANGETLSSVTVPNTGGWQNWQTVSAEVTLAQGEQELSLDFSGGQGYLFNVNWMDTELVNASGSRAYKTHSIPGRIQAEDYDIGGQDTAYYDSSSNNQGSEYRNDEVDVGNAQDIGGGHFVGWITQGEWLNYTISNLTQGNYDISVRVASASSGNKALSLELNDSALGQVDFTVTGGWQTWKTVKLENVFVNGGANQVLRLNMDADLFNVNWIEFTPRNEIGGDQCNRTQECKVLFGDRATDCLNSQSSTSICMCGTSPCQ